MLGVRPAVAEGASGIRVRPDVAVTATDLIAKYSNNSPLIMADPSDPQFVAMANRLDGPEFGCALQLSGNHGRTWVTGRPVPKLPPEVDRCYAPEIAFDGAGRFYYLFVGLKGSGNNPVGVFLTSSTDRARTFSPPRQILGPERYGVRMALDPAVGVKGRIHLVWLEARSTPPSGGLPPGPNPIMAAHSDDGGKSLSKPVRVSDPFRQRVVAPALALGRGHKVYVGFYDLQDDARDYEGVEGPVWDGLWSVVVASSVDGGRHFGKGIVAEPAVVPPQRVMLIYTMPPPSLAASSSGEVYLGWHDARNGDWDVFVRSSADGGRSWRSPGRVNDDPLGNKKSQYLPRLSVSPNGRLDVIFYDRRGDPENLGTWVYYTYSSDGASKFARNVRVNSEAFSSRIGPGYQNVSARGLVEFGGRLGLLSESSGALMAWADTRNTTRGPPAQDIFSGSVVLLGVLAGPSLPVFVLAGVALIALVFALVLRRGRSHGAPEKEAMGVAG